MPVKFGVKLLRECALIRNRYTAPYRESTTSIQYSESNCNKSVQINLTSALYEVIYRMNERGYFIESDDLILIPQDRVILI